MNISKAVKQIKHNFGTDAFIVDEENSKIKINLPFYKAIIKLPPYIQKEMVKKVIKKCIIHNNNITKMNNAKIQKKLL